jgi:quercetin dioxygenase-like cupin family protein
MAKQIEFVLVDSLIKQHLASKQTGGSFSLFENKSNGSSKTPIHVHAREDETLYVMQGAMRAIIAGEEHSLEAGESIFLPRGIPHQLMNESGSPAHYVLLCTPGGFEDFLAAGGHALTPGEIPQPPLPADIERMKAAAPRFGITMLANWTAGSSFTES